MKKFVTMLVLCFTFCLSSALFACDKAKEDSSSLATSSSKETSKSSSEKYSSKEDSSSVSDDGSAEDSSLVGDDSSAEPELATMTGIELQQNGRAQYDDGYHLPTVSGTLPAGAVTSWYVDNELSINGVKAEGTYEIKVVISCDGYEPLILTTSFTITPNFSDMALRVINAFGSVPDPWSFLPEGFDISNTTVTSSQIVDYSQWVNVEDIPTNYIGKQMNVVYGVLNTCDKALKPVNTVYAALGTIQTAYQTFLNDNPDNYAVFEDTTGVFQYKIELDGGYYALSTSVSGVEVALFGDTENETYGARIQLGDGNVLKYEISGADLRIAWDVSGVASTMIDFTRTGETVKGYIWEYLGVGSLMTSSSTLLEVGDTYTTVVGTKGDFIPSSNGRNCEVYENATGKFVGSEVSEVVTAPVIGTQYVFDTAWYTLHDVSGITTIRRDLNEGESVANGMNADTIYLNGNAQAISTTLKGGLSATAFSRRYDIEFKEVCAYIYDSETEEYTKTEFVVPMVFIQESYVSSFEEDFATSNSITVDLTTSSNVQTVVYNGYHTLVNEYTTMTTETPITQEDITSFCAKRIE